MDTLSALDPLAWRSEYLPLHPAYQAGNALGWLSLGNKQASTNYPLAGRLYVAKSGWLLLSVPNALVRGVYDALVAPGAELPTAGAMGLKDHKEELVNAHISVMTADEVAKIGADKINERGHNFHYTLGALKEIPINKAGNLSRVWAIQISSPQLSEIRKSYGLSPLPNGDHAFHITVACRRKGVLLNNSTSKGTTEAAPEISRGELKVAAADTVTYDCNCAGPCTCPETCTCRQHGCCSGAHKAASVTPPQPRVRVVMPYQGKYLMETLNNSKWPQNIGKRRFMGGGVEPGETPEQAAAREMFEELGVKIKPTAFRPLGNDPREGWQHEQYLELLKHKLKPGNFNASVGSDAVVTLSHGLPAGDDYMGPDIKALLAPALKKAADLLPGGKADNVPDSKFSPTSLAEGQKDEREHTNNNQVAKEIAKDHLSEDPRYYEKNREVEKSARPRIIEELLAAKEHSDNKRYDHKAQILRKLMAQAPQDWVIDDPKPKFQGVTHTPTKFQFHTARNTIPAGVKAANTGSVYGDQLKNTLSLRQPLVYDHTKPVFENVKNHLFEAKRRGDFILQAKRNQQQYRAALDPKYRYQLAMQAFHGQMEQPAVADQIIEQHGDKFLNLLDGRPQ